MRLILFGSLVIGIADHCWGAILDASSSKEVFWTLKDQAGEGIRTSYVGCG